MNNAIRCAVFGSAMALAACQQRPSSGDRDAAVQPSPTALAVPVATPSRAPSPSTASIAPAVGENDGVPDVTPAPLTPEAARTEKGARANLLAWARGIELREFDQAWALMGDAARTQISKQAFNRLFAPLRDITVAAPAGTMEGAAGSSYYKVPTVVTGTRADGSRATLKGEIVLRRVNDVPGASTEQLAWHIVRLDLKPV
jgi:hypothetical protein